MSNLIMSRLLILPRQIRFFSQTASKLELQLLRKEHSADVRSLLLKSFFLTEPLNVRFGYDLPTEVEDFIRYVVDNAVEDRCSFVYVDKNRLAAMILNSIKRKNDPDKSVEFQSATLRYIFKMLAELQKKRTVFDYLNTDRVLYSGIVSVDSDYRGQRLSEKLLEKSLTMAKNELKIAGAFAETTSFYSLKAFLKMNFNVADEILYENYDKNKLSKMGIHDRCSLVVRKL